jgi:hypothetical protein
MHSFIDPTFRDLAKHVRDRSELFSPLFQQKCIQRLEQADKEVAANDVLANALTAAQAQVTSLTEELKRVTDELAVTKKGKR